MKFPHHIISSLIWMRQLQKFKSLQVCLQISWRKFCWRVHTKAYRMTYWSYFLDTWLQKASIIKITSLIWDSIEIRCNFVKIPYFITYLLIWIHQLQKFKSLRVCLQMLWKKFCWRVHTMTYRMTCWSYFLDTYLLKNFLSKIAFQIWNTIEIW